MVRKVDDQGAGGTRIAAGIVAILMAAAAMLVIRFPATPDVEPPRASRSPPPTPRSSPESMSSGQCPSGRATLTSAATPGEPFRTGAGAPDIEIAVPFEMRGCRVTVEQVRVSFRTADGRPLDRLRRISYVPRPGRKTIQTLLATEGLKTARAGGDSCGLVFKIDPGAPPFSSARPPYEGDFRLVPQRLWIWLWPIALRFETSENQPIEVLCYSVDVLFEPSNGRVKPDDREIPRDANAPCAEGVRTLTSAATATQPLYAGPNLISRAEVAIPPDLDGCFVTVEAVRLSFRPTGGGPFRGPKSATYSLEGGLDGPDTRHSPRGLFGEATLRGSRAGGDECGLVFGAGERPFESAAPPYRGTFAITTLRALVHPWQKIRFQFEGDPVTGQPMEVQCFSVDIRVAYSAVRGELMDVAPPSHVYRIKPPSTPGPCRGGVVSFETKGPSFVSKSGEGPMITVPGYSTCVVKEIETAFSLYSPDLGAATQGGRATVRLIALGHYNDGILVKNARWSGRDLGGQCPDPWFIFGDGGGRRRGRVAAVSRLVQAPRRFRKTRRLVRRLERKAARQNLAPCFLRLQGARGSPLLAAPDRLRAA